MNLTRAKAAFLVLIALVGATTQAQAHNAVEDHEIYSQSLELCRHFDTQAVFARMRASAGDLADFHIFGLNEDLNRMIDSPAFYDALYECYRNDQASKTLFITSLMMADLSTKMLGELTFYRFMQALGPLFARLKAAHSGVYRAGVWANRALNLAFIADAVYQAYAITHTEPPSYYPEMMRDLADANQGRLSAREASAHFTEGVIQHGLAHDVNTAIDAEKIGMMEQLTPRWNDLAARVDTAPTAEQRAEAMRELQEVDALAQQIEAL